MQIIDRYILKEFVKYLSGSVILFTGVGMIAKILESLKLVNQYNGDSIHIWLYYLYNIPLTISIVMAPSFLLSISYVTSKLIQSKELMIIRSARRSIKRTMLPILIFSFFFSFFFLAFNEFVAYPGNLQAYGKKNHLRGRSLDFHAWRNRHEFNLKSKNRVFYINTFVPTQKKIYGLHVVELDEKENIQKIIRAKEADIEPNAWKLTDADIIFFEDAAFQRKIRYRKKEIDIPEDLPVFQNTYISTEEANVFQLLELIQFRRERGYPIGEFLVEFYWHLGFPFICFFFVIIGVIVSVKISVGGLASSLSSALLIAVLYFVIMFYTKALGSSEIISPFWAGSISNFLVGGISIFFWFRLVD